MEEDAGRVVAARRRVATVLTTAAAEAPVPDVIGLLGTGFFSSGRGASYIALSIISALEA